VDEPPPRAGAGPVQDAVRVRAGSCSAAPIDVGPQARFSARRFYTRPIVAHSGREEGRGLGLVALSTVAYGLLPVFGKVAYAAGVRPMALLAWRYVIAALVLALLERGHRPPLRVRLRLWAIGGIFVFNSVAYFRALEIIPASVTSLVLYVYPVLVALLAGALGLERLRLRVLAAAGAAFAGCALTAGGAPQGARLASAGVAWALAAALVYALYLVASARFGEGVPARQLALHVAQVAGIACIGLGLADGGLGVPADPRAVASVLGIAVVSTVLAMVTFLAGMALIGPTRASVLSSLEVVVTLALAALFLDERLSGWQWLGAALILAAVAGQNAAALARLGPRRRRRGPADPGSAAGIIEGP
jgi:drug/metabolite transporter (DMT)-like permease